jgi:ribose transport system substrate-binding protein
MRKLSVIIGIIIILIFSLFAGCSKNQNSGKKRIGVVLQTRAHQFYKDLEEGLKKTADKMGYEVVVVSAEFDINKQISQVEDMITQRVAAIVICPADSKGIGVGVKKANEAGIPVFTADIASDEGNVVCHIASDNKAGGRLAGEYLAKLLNGKGKIAVINRPTVTSVLDRVAGFMEAIAKYPGIKLVADVDGGGERDKSLKATSDVLQANPELDAIFGINDDSALGALSAVKEFKRDKIFMVGYDATPEANNAILSGGNLKADVVQYPDKIGIKTIEVINDYLNGKQVEKLIPVEIGIVDKESLQKTNKAN